MYKIVSYWVGPYRQKKSFRYTVKIGLWKIFQLSVFVLSREKCHYQSHWIRIAFGFSFRILVFFPFLRSLIVTVCKWYGLFSVLAAVIPKNSVKNDLGLRMVKASPFIHQRNRVARNASDASAADWRYQTYLKKYDIISRVLHGFFQGSEFLYNAVLYMIKCNNIEKAFNQYVI